MSNPLIMVTKFDTLPLPKSCLQTTKGRKYLNSIKIAKFSIYLLESKVRNNTIEWNNCIGSNFSESDIIVGLLLDQPEVHSDNPLSRII